MGNINFKKMSLNVDDPKPQKHFESVETFKFMDPFPEETSNGLYLNQVYFPEEIIIMILSYIEPKQILKASEVCKKWCNIIKSNTFWMDIYQRHYNKKPKKLPWYVYYCLFTSDYFDKNLIKNGNGQDGFEFWNIVANYGDQFKIEDPPCGADPLPVDVPEFNGKTSCFVTSYYECNKYQEISFVNNLLLQFIFNKFKPEIYLSEWIAARFDCGCTYKLWCKLLVKPGEVVKRRRVTPTDDEDSNNDEFELYLASGTDFLNHGDALHVELLTHREEQWAGSTWSKVEMTVKNYPKGVKRILFQHEGRDTQFWKGHYGSKMAGGVLKILFDSIEPLA